MTEEAKKAQYEYQKKYRKAYLKNEKPEQRQKRLEYHRKWRAEHPDKMREYQERFFEKKAREYGLIAEEDQATGS